MKLARNPELVLRPVTSSGSSVNQIYRTDHTAQIDPTGAGDVSGVAVRTINSTLTTSPFASSFLRVIIKIWHNIHWSDLTWWSRGARKCRTQMSPEQSNKSDFTIQEEQELHIRSFSECATQQRTSGVNSQSCPVEEFTIWATLSANLDQFAWQPSWMTS